MALSRRARRPAPALAEAAPAPATALPRTPAATRAAQELAAARPPRKPMARTRRVSLIEREVQVRLAPVALELLHGAARALTEGALDGASYSGSTMLTIDLADTVARVSDPPDAATAHRLAELYLADPAARARARGVGLAEARRAAGCDLAASQIDVETSHRGRELHVSLNVEAQRKRP